MTARELTAILETMDKKTDRIFMKGKFSIWQNGDLIIFGGDDVTYLGSLENVKNITMNENVDISFNDGSSIRFRGVICTL